MQQRSSLFLDHFVDVRMARKSGLVRVKAPKDDDDYTPRLSQRERAARHRKAQAAYVARKAAAARQPPDLRSNSSSASSSTDGAAPQDQHPGFKSPNDDSHSSNASSSSAATALAAAGDATSQRERGHSPESTCAPRSLTSTIASRHSQSGPALDQQSLRVRRLLQHVADLNAGPLTPPTRFARTFWIRNDHQQFTGNFLSKTQLLDIQLWIHSR
ncbi:hypothetical protein R3P38DRAFT_2815728 [Favolaschia claudopus]|uniref:Uncharacterized protein n=1 Tax=Favolaschia claudopus TaxID=2862362 RepID=A0AAV9Z0J0_9AGAR